MTLNGIHNSKGFWRKRLAYIYDNVYNAHARKIIKLSHFVAVTSGFWIQIHGKKTMYITSVYYVCGSQVLGTALPSMRDRTRLPYTEAVILEVQRMGDISPLGVPHCLSQDVEFRGYHIPKGTTIMPILYAVHRDPNIWKEPYTFNPDRFLDEEGNINRDERLIPFSMGEFAAYKIDKQ